MIAYDFWFCLVDATLGDYFVNKVGIQSKIRIIVKV